jgi:hypothetical protein
LDREFFLTEVLSWTFVLVEDCGLFFETGEGFLVCAWVFTDDKMKNNKKADRIFRDKRPAENRVINTSFINFWLICGEFAACLFESRLNCRKSLRTS